MRVQGSCVLISGAGAGIGKAAALHLLRAGCAVTALDLSEGGLRELRNEAGSSARLLTLKCDVSSDEQQMDAFQQHMQKWGRLDIALLIAGIGESGRVFGGECSKAWQKTLDIDLRAVLLGVHLATRSMVQCSSRGVIISVASAAGVFPMPEAPVYAAAKGGLVHFTRSSAPAAAKLGVRICTVCPQGVDTQLVAGMETYFGQFGPLLQTKTVVDAMLQLIEDDSKNGVASVIMQSGKTFEYGPDFKVGGAKPRQHTAPPRPSSALRDYASRPLPGTYRKWRVQKLSTSFSEACALVSADMPTAVGSGEILVRRLFSGINASDINFTSGKYHGSSAAAQKNLPFDAGFESVGVVLKAGANAGLQVGQAVATLTYGGFSEYAVQRASHTFPIASPSPEAVAMLTSGLTASVALKEVGKMTEGETVLVTAAAGGTGMFAVQLAKLAGNHVIGTCSSPEKAALLKQLGVDRVVNYKVESLKEVLKREYPSGVDIIYESVGGDMFEVAVNALANKGRLIVIGMMSQYGDGWPVSTHPGLPEKLLKKSASLSGFFLPMYAKVYKSHLATLFGLMDAGKLKVVIDPTPFVGIEAVPKAVAYLQSGASRGKVVVQIVEDKDLPFPRVVSRL